jgi:adenine phosphoribosyltransferase
MGMMQSTPCTPGTSRADYTQDGPVAQRIASVTPYFPFKGIDRFYDIGGFLKDPEAFALVVEVLVERYKDADIDSVCGLDARGFVLGPPLALALKKPFFMLRKKGKMPNAVTGAAYAKEYAGNDALSIPRGAVKAGDKVLVVDDLVATGGTLLAALDLIAKFDGVVPECARAAARGAPPRRPPSARAQVRRRDQVPRRAGGLREARLRPRAHLGAHVRGHPDEERPRGRGHPDGRLRRRRRGALGVTSDRVGPR